MVYTLTRGEVIAIGEDAIERVRDGRGQCIDPHLDLNDSAPELLAFRQVLKLGSAFGIGAWTGLSGTACPMQQTVFAPADGASVSGLVQQLAFAWDDAAEAATGERLFGVIEVRNDD